MASDWGSAANKLAVRRKEKELVAGILVRVNKKVYRMQISFHSEPLMS